MFYEFNYLISTINTSLFRNSLKAIIQPMYLRSIILLTLFSFSIDASQVNTSSGITSPEKLKNGFVNCHAHSDRYGTAHYFSSEEKSSHLFEKWKIVNKIKNCRLQKCQI